MLESECIGAWLEKIEWGDIKQTLEGEFIEGNKYIIRNIKCEGKK